ncbi:MAG: hypothetical protein ACRYF5_04630, partial [Janthinobacterium lividum]
NPGYCFPGGGKPVPEKSEVECRKAQCHDRTAIQRFAANIGGIRPSASFQSELDRKETALIKRALPKEVNKAFSFLAAQIIQRGELLQIDGFAELVKDIRTKMARPVARLPENAALLESAMAQALAEMTPAEATHLAAVLETMDEPGIGQPGTDAIFQAMRRHVLGGRASKRA